MKWTVEIEIDETPGPEEEVEGVPLTIDQRCYDSANLIELLAEQIDDHPRLKCLAIKVDNGEGDAWSWREGAAE